jgi:hypothetical protein
MCSKHLKLVVYFEYFNLTKNENVMEEFKTCIGGAEAAAMGRNSPQQRDRQQLDQRYQVQHRQTGSKQRQL